MPFLLTPIVRLSGCDFRFVTSAFFLLCCLSVTWLLVAFDLLLFFMFSMSANLAELRSKWFRVLTGEVICAGTTGFSAVVMWHCTCFSLASSVRNFRLQPLNMHMNGLVSMWSTTWRSSQLKLHEGFLYTLQPFHRHLKRRRLFWLKMCFDLMCSTSELSTSVEWPT